MPCKCSIVGCPHASTRLSLYQQDYPASIFCRQHYEQIASIVKSHREHGWLDNDEHVKIQLYRKDKIKVIAFTFKDDKVLYTEI